MLISNQSYRTEFDKAIAGAVLRKDLIKQIFEEDRQVHLFQAPAGHGKTTTLRQLKTHLEERGWQTSWLTFDLRDNDPQKFGSTLSSFIKDLNINSQSDSFEYGSSFNSLDSFLEILYNIKSPTALFFDEFQVLNDDYCIRFFKDLLGHLPENVKIYIASRVYPDLGLANLAVKGVLKKIDVSSLSFSEKEVKEFFAQSFDVEINDLEISSIYKKTVGWPAALQLFKLALPNQNVRSALIESELYSPKELAEYLSDSVLSLQPEHIKSFLLASAVLRKMNVEQCNFVLQRTDTASILDYMVASGLFISETNLDSQWYKYHSLFSRFLLNAYQKDSPESVLEIHARAAEWYLQAGNYEEAIYHLTAAKNFNAAALALNSWGSSLLANAELKTFERWFLEIPFEHIRGNTPLLIKASYAMIFLRRRDVLKNLISEIDSKNTSSSIDETTDQILLIAMSKLFEDRLTEAFQIC